MSFEPRALTVMSLYGLTLYVILRISPRLSPSLRVKTPWWRNVRFWASFVATVQIFVYALFS